MPALLMYWKRVGNLIGVLKFFHIQVLGVVFSIAAGLFPAGEYSVCTFNGGSKWVIRLEVLCIF